MTEAVKQTKTGWYDSDIEVFGRWWKSLDDNRCDRAGLRRSESPEDTLTMKAFHNFLNFNGMSEKWGAEKNLICSAIIASSLSHIKTPIFGDDRSFAIQLGDDSAGRPVMSELRFRRLLKSNDPGEFQKRLLGAIRLLDGKVNFRSLVLGIIKWHKEFLIGPDHDPRKRLAFQWAKDYYGKSGKNYSENEKEKK